MATERPTIELAIDGFDPIAYWEEGRARKGLPEFSCEWNGKVWRFSSLERLEEFLASPARYAPEFAGHCAFGMSIGQFAEGSPKHFELQNGRLFLQSNAVVRWLFRVLPGRRQAADKNWSAAGSGGRSAEDRS